MSEQHFKPVAQFLPLGLSHILQLFG